MRKPYLLLIIIAVFVCKLSYAQTQGKLPGVVVTGAIGQRLNSEQFIDSISKIIANSKTNRELRAYLYFKRADYYRSTNQFEKAYQDYTSCLNIDGNFKYAVWNRGLANEALNNLQAADADYHKALTIILPPDSSDKAILYCNIAYVKLRLQKPDSALVYDSLSISYNSLYARGYLIRGLVHMAQKNYLTAIADFTQAIQLNRNYSNAKMLSAWYSDLADAKRLNKQYKEAINNYSFALKLDPDNRSAYWNRAAAYYKHKDYELAADDYTKTITYFTGQNTELSKLYDDRAMNELGQNFLNKAIQDDSLAIVLDANNKLAYLNLAAIYTQNADYQKSIDLFKTALDFQKENKKFNSFLYYQIANDEYFLNEFDKVVDDCTMSISLNPSYASAYFYRAKVYLKKLNKKDIAITDFNKVIELDTTHKSVDYIFSLVFTGKADDALSILQHDVVNTTDDAELLVDYYNIACLYSLTNKPDDANSYLKMAVDRGYNKKYAAADEDLDNIRNTADYKSIIGTPAQ